MGYIDTAKQWFKTRLKPTQAQFWQTFEWLRWKDEAISITDITGLSDALAALAAAGGSGIIKPIGIQLSGDGFFDFPAGMMLDKMLVKPVVESNMLMGTTDGGGELFTPPGEPIPANKFYPVTVDLIAEDAVQRVWFTNITSQHLILIYTRTLSFYIP